MNRIRSNCFLALCAFMVASNAQSASAQAQSTSARPAQNDGAAAPRVAPKVPDRFTPYASASIGHGRRCVSGASTDEDGMNQRPAVHATDASGKHVRWIARIDLPADTYQSRATHCTGHGNALYVLLQSDTQAPQSLSQTLLRVVRIDAASGAVQLQQDVHVPAAHSAWVDKGASRFFWSGNRLVVTGHFRAASDPERRQGFALRLDPDLKPQGSKP